MGCVTCLLSSSPVPTFYSPRVRAGQLLGSPLAGHLVVPFGSRIDHCRDDQRSVCVSNLYDL